MSSARSMRHSSALMQTRSSRRPAPAPNVTAGLMEVLLGHHPSAIIETLKGALQRGVPPVELITGSGQCCRHADLPFHHGERVRTALDEQQHTPSPTATRSTRRVERVSRLRRGVISFNWCANFFPRGAALLSLLFPEHPNPVRCPESEARATTSPRRDWELLLGFLLTLDRQAQINEAGCIAAPVPRARHPVGPLIGKWRELVVREDAYCSHVSDVGSDGRSNTRNWG